MTVYVDPIYTSGPFKGWCHMWSPDPLELSGMANAIGLRRQDFRKGWLNESRSGLLHYDLRASMRREAVACGAVEVGRMELGRLLREARR